MKRFIVIGAVAAVLTVLLASTTLAAGPVGGRWAQDTTPQAGTCPMGGEGMMQGGRPAWAGQPDKVATLLGMTAQQIQAERQAGKSLAQIAESKNVGVEKLVDTILAAKKTSLQQAVTDGKLTQAQADAMVQNMQAMVKAMVERTTTGPMMGHQGMMGGRGQGMMQGQGMMRGRGQGMMRGQSAAPGTSF